MSNCNINGKLCFECCKVIAIPGGTELDDELKLMLTLTTPAIAFSLNKHAYAAMPGNVDWYLCKHFNGSGCDNYDNRPSMCRDYPLYGRTDEQFKSGSDFRLKRNYTDDCTYFVEVK